MYTSILYITRDTIAILTSSNQQEPSSMSSNLQPSANSSLRSASLGSNFFNKDLSSFFVKDDTSGTDDSTTIDDSTHTPAPGDLDIVGALGTLDLDDDIEKKSVESAVPDKSNSSTPFSQQPQFLQNVQHGAPLAGSTRAPSGVSYGSLTPNPPSVGAFAGAGIPGSLNNPGNTPSSTWGNNFIPFSAPPFAYPVTDPAAVSELAMLIAPFELPEESTGKDAKNAGPIDMGANSNIMTSPQTMHPFGGVLDSRFAFGNFSEPFVFSDYSRDLKESEKGKKQFDLDKSHDKMQAPLMSNNMPNVWNQPPQYAHYVGRNQQVGDNSMGQGDRFNHNSVPSNGNNRFNNNYNNNAGHGHGNNYHQHNGRRNFNMNSGVNVHRKMHNSHRRRGDDAAKYANAKLEDFTGDIFSLCKDQHGCRFLQKQLDLGREVASKNGPEGLASDVAATMIFNEIYLKIVELMTDPFGNYLIQKLFENVSADQRFILVRNAAPEFIRIALDPHGTRALQKLVECVSTPEESQLIVDSLSPHVVTLSRDLNGNHVVQKCLQRLSPDVNQFIFDSASDHCNEIATHRHGCCVLQRCLDHGNAEQRKQLSMKVAENATNLSLDPFGNYVVQYVVSRGDEQSIGMIVDHIRANIVLMSLHKFGSNVIEKSLRIGKLTDTIIDVLLANSEKFGMMLNDPFGNYVLQTSLDVANSDDLAKLALALLPLLPNIKNTPHGRRIMTKIQNVA